MRVTTVTDWRFILIVSSMEPRSGAGRRSIRSPHRGAKKPRGQKTGRTSHDLRNARVSLCAGTAAGALEAVRDGHTEAVGEAWHPAGRLFHHAGRSLQPGADLFPRLGVSGRTRDKMGCVHD